MAFSGKGAMSGAASGAGAGAAFGPYGAIIGGVGGGLLGGLFSGDDEKKKADAERRAAIEELLRTEEEMGASAFSDVSADPRIVAAQRSVLDRMMREGSATGLGVEGRAALSEAQNAVSARERGSREAILEEMARRGMSGSGSELAAALSNQQGSADRAAAAGTQAAADARRRQLQMLAESGRFASGMRGQDFGEKSTRASALDAIARFNAGQRLSKAGMIANTRMGNAPAYDNRAAQDDLFGAGAASALGTAAGYLTQKKPGGG